MEQVENEILNTEHTYNLFYGLLDNELKHISEVKNGLKCDCICPACEKKLVARNGGQKRKHHFAHYESAECKYGVQTSIHIAAKNILERVKK
jgi:competence CoiA-like predicted nuclease